VQQPADGEGAKPRRREPELLADLDGTQRDASRVVAGRAVLLAEAGEQPRRCEPMNASQPVTSSTARRSPVSVRDGAARRRSRG